MHVALKLSQQVKIDTLDSPTGAMGVPHITTWSVGNTDGCVCVCGVGGVDTQQRRHHVDPSSPLNTHTLHTQTHPHELVSL